MQFIYEPDLLSYMEEKHLRNISVEVASSAHSDFEVTEIYLRLAEDKLADALESKRHYQSRKTDVGRVLLPPYRLKYDEVVTFGLRKYWIFRKLTFRGIHL